MPIEKQKLQIYRSPFYTYINAELFSIIPNHSVLRKTHSSPVGGSIATKFCLSAAKQKYSTAHKILWIVMDDKTKLFLSDGSLNKSMVVGKLCNLGFSNQLNFKLTVSSHNILLQTRAKVSFNSLGSDTRANGC